VRRSSLCEPCSAIDMHLGASSEHCPQDFMEQSRLSIWEVVGHFQVHCPSSPLNSYSLSTVLTGATGGITHRLRACNNFCHATSSAHRQPHRRINMPVYHSRIPANDLYDPTRRRLQERNWHKADLTESMKGALLTASVSGPKFQVHGNACTVVHT
jgi:hypothetical protein